VHIETEEFFRRSAQTACCYWILNHGKSSSIWNSQTNASRLWWSVCWCEYSKTLGKGIQRWRFGGKQIWVTKHEVEGLWLLVISFVKIALKIFVDLVILWKNNYAALKIINVGIILFFYLIKISFCIHFLFKWWQNLSARPRRRSFQDNVFPFWWKGFLQLTKQLCPVCQLTFILQGWMFNP